jgi:hypothetical protein
LQRRTRIAVAISFAIAFVAGAALMFGLVAFAGELLGLATLPLHVRATIAAAVLIVLAAIDLVAISKSTYCPIGWRRQTPRVLLRRYDLRVAALLWGFDTGLLVTTFRVAAVSWGALLLTALGLARAWTGISYGLGFAIPFLFLVFRPRLGRASRSAAPEEPGLAAMLGRRPLLQWTSAALLSASGVLILL